MLAMKNRRRGYIDITPRVSERLTELPGWTNVALTYSPKFPHFGEE
jgi:hypothetical protein